MKGATLYSGGGGVEALLKDRINFVHAVEYDAAIAAVYRQNIGDHVTVAKVEDVDYTTWGALDYGHASPVCKEYSQAKTGGAEGESDMSGALAVCRFLRACTPRVFTLENVQGYLHGAAYRLICQTLSDMGYMWHAEVLNSANYGVPQTRRRLILRAVRDALLPGLPAPQPWVGWYAAVEDLLPTLPASAFAPWQLARLPESMSGSLLVGGGNTQLTQIDSRPRMQGSPMFTVSAGTASLQTRAFLVDGANEGRDISVRSADCPVWTIGAAAEKAPARAWLGQGRVVKMTPRAVARFQSVPDWYVLPDTPPLACMVVGNMAPPLLMNEIVGALL